jgi:hypothetical protein
MSRRSFRDISPVTLHDIDDGTGSDPYILLQRYREQLYTELEDKILEANVNARKRNMIFSKHGSLVRYRELMERRAEKKIAQRALTLGVVYRTIGAKHAAWSSFGVRHQERREQNDKVIENFLSMHRTKKQTLSMSDDAGKVIAKHLVTFTELDLTNFNDPTPWSMYVHDAWHRNSSQRLHIGVRQRGDIVTLTWTKNEIDEGKRESSLGTNSTFPKDQYTFFRGNKRWLLVDFESTLSTEWSHMELIRVFLEDDNTDEDDFEQETEGGTKVAHRNPELSRKKKKKKETPRLELTSTGKQFQDQLNKDVTHMIVTRKVHKNEMGNNGQAQRSSMSNQRMSFLGSHLYDTLGYNAHSGKLKHSTLGLSPTEVDETEHADSSTTAGMFNTTAGS